MAIKHWPASERPREKLLARGVAALSDAELLALFLGTGPRGSDALSLARELLIKTCSLRELLDRSPKAMSQLHGIGPARACLLSAALELGRRHLAAELDRGQALTDPRSAATYFSQQLRDQSREVFACLYLDSRHRALGFEPLFFGSIDRAQVHPREVVKRALQHNAAAVIVGHNHPSGVCEASQADRQITDQLRQALALVDIRLLDHFIIGDGPPLSMAEHGWI